MSTSHRRHFSGAAAAVLRRPRAKHRIITSVSTHHPEIPLLRLLLCCGARMPNTISSSLCPRTIIEIHLKRQLLCCSVHMPNMRSSPMCPQTIAEIHQKRQLLCCGAHVPNIASSSFCLQIVAGNPLERRLLCLQRQLQQRHGDDTHALKYLDLWLLCSKLHN